MYYHNFHNHIHNNKRIISICQIIRISVSEQNAYYHRHKQKQKHNSRCNNKHMTIVIGILS